MRKPMIQTIEQLIQNYLQQLIIKVPIHQMNGVKSQSSVRNKSKSKVETINLSVSKSDSKHKIRMQIHQNILSHNMIKQPFCHGGKQSLRKNQKTRNVILSDAPKIKNSYNLDNNSFNMKRQLKQLISKNQLKYQQKIVAPEFIKNNEQQYNPNKSIYQKPQRINQKKERIKQAKAQINKNQTSLHKNRVNKQSFHDVQSKRIQLSSINTDQNVKLNFDNYPDTYKSRIKELIGAKSDSKKCSNTATLNCNHKHYDKGMIIEGVKTEKSKTTTKQDTNQSKNSSSRIANSHGYSTTIIKRYKQQNAWLKINNLVINQQIDIQNPQRRIKSTTKLTDISLGIMPCYQRLNQQQKLQKRYQKFRRQSEQLYKSKLNEKFKSSTYYVNPLPPYNVQRINPNNKYPNQ